MRERRPAGKRWQVGMLAVLLALLGARWYLHERSLPTDRQVCASHLRRLGTITLAYAMDHGGRLPREDAEEEIRPYAAEMGVTGDHSCPVAARRGETSYSINHFLAGRDLWKLTDESDYVLLYEGWGGAIALRHDDGANYYLADGRLVFFRGRLSLRPFGRPVPAVR